MDINQIYGADHLAVHTSINNYVVHLKLICFLNYTSIKKNEKNSLCVSGDEHIFLIGSFGGNLGAAP